LTGFPEGSFINTLAGTVIFGIASLLFDPYIRVSAISWVYQQKNPEAATINQAFLDQIKLHYPQVSIGYKDQSTLMRVLGKLAFFSPDFMTQYVTTIGNTIYFPSATYLSAHPVTTEVVLLHELTHIHDSQKYGQWPFFLAYLFPQILFLLAPLLFLLSWKIAIVAMVAFLLPIPAYFRMIFEQRAYMTELYAMQYLNTKYNYHINLSAQSDFCITQFKDSGYYWMWPFPDVDQRFSTALNKIRAGQRPYDDPLFDAVDDILTKA
jgi:hypothetical protein